MRTVPSSTENRLVQHNAPFPANTTPYNSKQHCKLRRFKSQSDKQTQRSPKITRPAKTAPHRRHALHCNNMANREALTKVSHKFKCLSVFAILVIRILLQSHTLLVATNMSLGKQVDGVQSGDMSPSSPLLHSQPYEIRTTATYSLTTSSDMYNVTTTETAMMTTTMSTSGTTTTSTTTSPPVIQQVDTLSQPYCTLGDETFQIGERWNPILPPFGVQVCVLCECLVRQRKNCYEARVACRRIADECPVIESCPDGKRPVTVGGQCCKSCQSTTAVLQAQQQQQSQQQQEGQQQSPAYEQAPAQQQQQAATKSARAQPFPPLPPSIMAFKIVYMDERTKEYLSMVKSFPACTAYREGGERPPPNALSNSNQPHQKSSKGNSRNTLNGIDTRWAFKSLSDAASANHVGPAASSKTTDYNGGDQTTSSNGLNQQQTAEDSLRHDQQHPNDVQSSKQSQNGGAVSNNSQSWRTGTSNGTAPTGGQHSLGTCNLGGETFQIGDQWNPILPPLGVQVCVLCECGFRVKKNCFEAKLDCRRINKDCPAAELCPDGKRPVTVAGQCCKSCQQTNVEQQEQQLDVITSGSNSTSISSNSTPPPQQLSDGPPQRNERVYRDFQTISKSLNICSKRDSSETNGTRSRFTKAQSKRATVRHNNRRQPYSAARKL